MNKNRKKIPKKFNRKNKYYKKKFYKKKFYKTINNNNNYKNKIQTHFKICKKLI